MMDLVSIILVTYNQEDYIEHSIRSAIEQTYSNIELIIADDASSDATYDVICSMVNEATERLSRVEIIHNEKNVGLSKNLSGALSIAKGRWVKILYGDDILMPSCIEDNMRLLSENPDACMIHSSCFSCSESTKYDEINELNIIQKPKSTLVTPQTLFDYYFIITPTAFVDRKIYMSSLDDKIGIDDWGTFIEVAMHGRVCYLDKPTVAFRVVKNSMSRFTVDEKGRVRLNKMVNAEIMVMDKYKNNPQINPIRGIKKCCDQAVSLAIDLHDEELIRKMKKYAKDNGTSISFNIKMKELMGKIGLLKTIQRMKRKLGLETTTVFEV